MIASVNDDTVISGKIMETQAATEIVCGLMEVN